MCILLGMQCLSEYLAGAVHNSRSGVIAGRLNTEDQRSLKREMPKYLMASLMPITE